MSGVKRLTVVAAVGLALAVVLAAHAALRAPEREPVPPIELPIPVAQPGADEPTKARVERTTAPERKTGQPAATGRRARATPLRSPEALADDDRADDRTPTPEHPSPLLPSPGSDDSDDAGVRDDDARADDAGDDDAGDD